MLLLHIDKDLRLPNILKKPIQASLAIVLGTPAKVKVSDKFSMDVLHPVINLFYLAFIKISRSLSLANVRSTVLRLLWTFSKACM